MMGVQAQCDGERDNEGPRDTDAMKSREYTIVHTTLHRDAFVKCNGTQTATAVLPAGTGSPPVSFELGL